jgi:hypothetical protein
MRTTLRKAAPKAGNSGFVHAESSAGAHWQPDSAASPSSTETREAMIQVAAYSFYERRGMIAGHELEDWLQAEMEVDRQLSNADTTRPAN